MFLETEYLTTANLMLHNAMTRLFDAEVYEMDMHLIPEYSGQVAYWECAVSILKAMKGT